MLLNPPLPPSSASVVTKRVESDTLYCETTRSSFHHPRRAPLCLFPIWHCMAARPDPGPPAHTAAMESSQPLRHLAPAQRAPVIQLHPLSKVEYLEAGIRSIIHVVVSRPGAPKRRADSERSCHAGRQSTKAHRRGLGASPHGGMVELASRPKLALPRLHVEAAIRLPLSHGMIELVHNLRAHAPRQHVRTPQLESPQQRPCIKSVSPVEPNICRVPPQGSPPGAHSQVHGVIHKYGDTISQPYDTFSGGWLNRQSSPNLQCPVLMKKWQSGCPGPAAAQARGTHAAHTTHSYTRTRTRNVRMKAGSNGAPLLRLRTPCPLHARTNAALELERAGAERMSGNSKDMWPRGNQPTAPGHPAARKQMLAAPTAKISHRV